MKKKLKCLPSVSRRSNSVQQFELPQMFSKSWRKAIKYLSSYIVLFTVMMNMQILLMLFRKPWKNYNSWMKN